MSKPILQTIQIIKRNGIKRKFDKGKITDRLTRLICLPGRKPLECNAAIVVAKTIQNINRTEITTSEIDEMTAEHSYACIHIHTDYETLAARIKIANLHKKTDDCFSGFIDRAANNTNNTLENNPYTPLINGQLIKFVKNNKGRINRLINDDLDFNYDWLGINTMIDRYLIKCSGDEHDKMKRPQDFVIERPQYMWMRASCSFALNNKWVDDSSESIFSKVEEIYTCLSLGYISLATPTMKNAGTLNPQLLSCFLLFCPDSTDGITDLQTRLAKISKSAGGVGWSMHLRPPGTEVKRTSGRSAGKGPFLRVIEKTLEAWDQGGNRPGSGADYMRVWEAEFMTWLRYRRPHEPAEFSIRKLFYACWLDDYFMECVENDYDWYFISKYEHPQLSECYGKEFQKEYRSITDKIREGTLKNKYGSMHAREVWDAIMTTIIETGMPYMLNADRINELSNQKNIGLIHNSNLCVTGNTTVLTSKGSIPIDELKDQDVEVWNGLEWSPTTVRQTSESAEIMNIEFEDGTYIYCTPYHKFYKRNGSKIQTSDLEIGMQIERLDNLPVIHMKDTGKFKYAYTEGFFSGDGTYSNGVGKKANRESNCAYSRMPNELYCTRHFESWKNIEHVDDPSIKEDRCCAKSYSRLPQISLYGKKKELKIHLHTIGNEMVDDKHDKITVRLPIDIVTKFEVPFNESVSTKLVWFAGLMDSDGCDLRNETGMQISNIDKHFLYNIKLMLQTLGINVSIGTMRKACKSMMPDGKGGTKEYDCKECFRISLTSNDVYNLRQLGWETYRLSNQGKHQSNRKKYPKVSKIIRMDDPEPTYCFTELKRNRGVFNGILTGQCAEIVEVATPDRVACCCLGTLPVSSFLKLKPEYIDEHKVEEIYTSESSGTDSDNVSKRSSSPTTFGPRIKTTEELLINKYEMDWDLFKKTAKSLVWILNKIIDINDYPVVEAKLANDEQRPLGIGIQGMADAHAMMKMVWGSSESRKFCAQIAECLHFSCLQKSNDMSKKNKPYPYFKANSKFPLIENSPLADGIFQWQQWHSTESGKNLNLKPVVPDADLNLDWTSLQKSVVKHGVRNSLLNAYPPTASSSNIQGKIESFEPFKSNAYLRKTITGTFIILNKYLVADLQHLGLWNKTIYKQMINDNGSVQHIQEIPQEIRDLYRTAWEIDPLVMAEISALYAPWVDQTLSDNIFIPDASDGKLLTRTLLHRRRLGLKTLMYYCKQTNVEGKRKFVNDSIKDIKKEPLFCSIDNPDCEACQG
jgi:ribonucleoside-diphosphate reductase alpha chain